MNGNAPLTRPGQFSAAEQATRWFIPLGALLALMGYWGPWIDHAAAGLIISGLDLGEYVKFLIPVRTGQMTLWREGFYLPLIAVSISLSLAAYRPRFAYPLWLRVLLVLVACTAAANLLPPAWSPPILLLPEFRLQTTLMAACIATALLSPFWALLPVVLVRIFNTLLIVGAMTVPLWLLATVWAPIQEIYVAPLQGGWGPMLLLPGLFLLLVGWWLSPTVQPVTPVAPDTVVPRETQPQADAA